MGERRITISRDGVVKLNGKPTRWRVWQLIPTVWRVMRPDDSVALRCSYVVRARAYLAGLTDEELMG